MGIKQLVVYCDQEIGPIDGPRAKMHDGPAKRELGRLGSSRDRCYWEWDR
ncbi:hypothetical protein HYR53_04060 [Candidatus Acetothermia bacterium]|nr:hypothetical protein [Candidatus Acetothermia bacterium]